MRIPEIFSASSEPVISFEVFPPKTNKALSNLESILPRLVDLRPHYMTVTYGAMGSTQERTLEIAARIKREYDMETASHLTCVGATREAIDAVLTRLGGAGIENIVALRGDPPQGQDHFEPPPGGYAHANELVEHIRRRGGFGIAVAGYPEKHIEAPSWETDLRYLRQKVDAGADIVVTQLFYDNADYFRFVGRARDVGVEVPIVPGLLPIQSFQQIRRITSMCGARIPPALRDAMAAAGGDADAVREIGTDWAIEQCRDLLSKNVPGIHFYVLNRAGHMEKIFAAI